jgi:hypothetical protein
MWIFLSVLVQAQTSSKKTEKPLNSFAEAAVSSRISQDQQFDWSKVSPIEFLDILKKRLRYGSFFTVWTAPPAGWMKEADVEQLMKLIKSKDPAGHVITSRESHLPSKHSTVGRQAMFLIEGFRKGSYPPFMSSEDYKGNPSEFKKWWSKRHATVDAPAKDSFNRTRK